MNLFQNLKRWYKKYEHHATAAAFMLGFIWDTLTLTRVDLLFSNIVFTAYLLIAAGSIIILHTHAAGRLRMGLASVRFLTLLIPFAFGNLLSGYLVSYTKSGSLFASWPFLVALLFLAAGNELFKKRYQLLIFQLSVLFISIFSYATFLLPVLLKRIDGTVFLISGAVSLLVFGGIIFILNLINAKPLRGRLLWGSITGLYLLFNVAYFTNLIPPLPLSLREIGVYHTVTPESGRYRLTYEGAAWYRLFERTSRTIHLATGEGAHVFSSVFAPVGLTTTLFHHWYYFANGEWVERHQVAFQIQGGREGGYRVYSFKQEMPLGDWRVDVTTKRGQVVGRIYFSADLATVPLQLLEREL